MPSGELAKVRPHLALFHTDNNSNEPSATTKDRSDLCILLLRADLFSHHMQQNCLGCIDYTCKCITACFVARSPVVSLGFGPIQSDTSVRSSVATQVEAKCSFEVPVGIFGKHIHSVAVSVFTQMTHISTAPEELPLWASQRHRSHLLSKNYCNALKPLCRPKRGGCSLSIWLECIDSASQCPSARDKCTICKARTVEL